MGEDGCGERVVRCPQRRRQPECAAERASRHPTGEINEWGDNLVQPENKRQRERYDMTEGEEEEEQGQRERYGMTEW